MDVTCKMVAPGTEMRQDGKGSCPAPPQPGLGLASGFRPELPATVPTCWKLPLTCANRPPSPQTIHPLITTTMSPNTRDST
jgi:hypothetical protein